MLRLGLIPLLVYDKLTLGNKTNDGGNKDNRRVEKYESY